MDSSFLSEPFVWARMPFLFLHTHQGLRRTRPLNNYCRLVVKFLKHKKPLLWFDFFSTESPQREALLLRDDILSLTVNINILLYIYMSCSVILEQISASENCRIYFYDLQYCVFNFTVFCKQWKELPCVWSITHRYSPQTPKHTFGNSHTHSYKYKVQNMNSLQRYRIYQLSVAPVWTIWPIFVFTAPASSLQHD